MMNQILAAGVEDVSHRWRYPKLMISWSVSAWRCFLAVTLFASEAAATAPTLSVVVLPSRRPDAGSLRDRVHAVAESVAARLGAAVVPTQTPRSLDIVARLDRARHLALEGSIDEAAALMDPTLDEATRTIDALDVSAATELVTAVVRRAVIALARGEVALARRLLSRVLTYDPTFDLLPIERSPQVRAALDDVRRELGADRPLDPTDLGDACTHAAVIIVGRPSSTGTGATIELSRFDQCRLVARSTLSATDREASAVATLSQAALPREPGDRERRLARGRMVGGAVIALAGLALVATGAYYAAHAADLKGGLDRCTATAPCRGELLLSQGDDFDRSRITASTLLPVGVAALVASVVVFALAAKHRRSGRTLAVLHPAWAF
jgi:hypothetical protein